MKIPRPIKWGLILMAVAVVIAAFAGWYMVAMPGSSYEGEITPMDGERQQLAGRLEADVRVVADDIGPRHVRAPQGLKESVAFLEDRLIDLGYEPRRQTFETRDVPVHNIEVEITGRKHPDEIVIIGAHYDSAGDIPAANDNGSGVAATLELARVFADASPERTLRFVFFVNEEPPWFQTENMGSLVYASRSRERSEDIVAMVSLETIGYFSDEPGSQNFPVGMLEWIYTDRGNFIAFVGNLGSRSVLREAMEAFRKQAQIPSEGASLPSMIPGVGWSDHWAFWQEGYPAIMVTDTAPFRYPYYHTVEDTPEKLDYENMALVVEGLVVVVEQLADR